jgi:hypothetical protein
MKQTLKITGSDELPEVIFDKEKNEFKLKGRSLPEDSYKFYKPLIIWMDEYLKNPNEKTHFNVFLEYFNSSSVKHVFFLLSKLEALIKDGKEAKIIWHYQSGDDLMKTKGMEFKKLLKVPFEMKEHHKN